MSGPYIPVDKLNQTDLEAYSVWEYANRIDLDDTILIPHRRVPVAATGGKIFAVQVRLAEGSKIWGILGNIDGENPRATQHLLTLSVLRNRSWFPLARYHDIAAMRNSPAALARFLDLELDDVFPIHYDISGLAIGNRWSLVGFIPKEPTEKLSRDEIIALAIS